MAKGNRGGKNGTWERRTLGRKKTPPSAQKSAERVNPNYQKSVKLRDAKYTENCQRCIWAFEAQQRGYDVEAKPYEGKKDPFYTGKANWLGVVDYIGRGERFGSYHVDQEMSNKMAKWGDGARAIVYVQWKRGSAHVFNAVQSGGATYYYDAQSGRQIDVTKYLADAVKNKTIMWRVDDKPFNQAVELAVRKRRTTNGY